MASNGLFVPPLRTEKSGLQAGDRISVLRKVAVNAAFLQEIKQDNVRLRELLHAIERVPIESLVSRRFVASLAALLGEIRDQLAMHFALEEAYGYFDEALNAAPELSNRAFALRGEHASLYTQIRDLANAAEGLTYAGTSNRAVQEIFARARAFRDQLHRHECREMELIVQAFDDDVGVGD